MKVITKITFEGTKKGFLKKGARINAKDYFTDKEESSFMDRGLLVEDAESEDLDSSEKTLEELLKADLNSLKKGELQTICDHYNLSRSGVMDELKDRIVQMDALLALESFDEVSDEDLALLANYAGVELGEDKEENIVLIETALEEAE